MELREQRSCETALAVAAIAAAALAIRLFRLQSQSLWMDEIASLLDARAFGSGGMVSLAHADHIAPLHSIILRIATLLGGENALAMRMPSVIAGTLTVPLFYLLGVRLFHSRAVGLISSALVAVSPFAVWYSQEARMYALLLFFTCAYVVVAWPIVARSLRASELLLLALVTATGLYCHHYMSLVPAAFGLFLLVSLGPAASRFWSWLATQVVAFLPFIYWLALTSGELHDQAGVAKPYVWGWLPYTIYTFAVGFSLGPSVAEMHTGALRALAAHPAAVLLAMAAVLAVGIEGLRRALRPQTRMAGVWCIVWTLVPIGLAVLATFLTNISYNVRYVIGSFPPFVLCVALASDAARRTVATAFAGQPFRLVPWVNVLAVGVLCGCLVMSLFNAFFDGHYAREDVRDAARFLRANTDPPHLLILDNSRIVPILAFYGERQPAEALTIPDLEDGRVTAAVERRIATLARHPDREIWLLEYRPWESDPMHSVQRQLDSARQFTREYAWPGVSIRCYR